MIAYNKDWLYKLYIREQADEALHYGAISADTHKSIYAQTVTQFYTPNIYARIGLALATMLVVTMGWSFFAFFFSITLGWDKVIDLLGPVFLLMACAGCYIMAISYIRKNNYYNAGADNMLVWIAAIVTPNAIQWLCRGHIPEVVFCLLLLATTVFAALKFVDILMSVCALIALLLVVWYITRFMGAAGNLIASLGIMGISGVVCYLLTGLEKLQPLYRNAIYYTRLASLITLYAAGNYYIVAQAATGFYNYETVAMPTTLGAFFWCCTFGVPVVYIYLGIRRRDVMLLRTGALLVVAGILTFRKYHSVLPVEIALTAAGALCIGLAYWLMGFLKVKAGGFTSQRGFTGHEKSALEQLVEGQMMKQDNDSPAPAEDTRNTW